MWHRPHAEHFVDELDSASWALTIELKQNAGKRELLLRVFVLQHGQYERYALASCIHLVLLKREQVKQAQPPQHSEGYSMESGFPRFNCWKLLITDLYNSVLLHELLVKCHVIMRLDQWLLSELPGQANSLAW